MTSVQTSTAAARAPARSPCSALVQIDSTLALVLDGSPGARWSTDLQTATAWATPAALAPLSAPVVAVGVVVVAGVDAGAGVVAAAGAELAVELDVLELLPQPAARTVAARAPTSHVRGVRIMVPPGV